MISDFETNTIYFSELLKTDSKYQGTYKEIQKALKAFGIEPKLLPNTKDIWARDYMPIQIDKDTFIEYRYDPDYLQSEYKGYRDLKTYPDMVCDKLRLKTVKSDIIMDGGNFVKSSDCVILVDKIVNENRLNYTKLALIKELHETFQVEKIILIPWDKKELYGHADGMFRFIDVDTVLVSHIYRKDSVLLYRLKSAGIKVEFMDFKITKRHENNWAYINFLQTKDIILLPKFGIEEDQQALEQIERWYPQYKGRIAQINMAEVVRYGGALNCISWTTKE